MAVLCIGEMLIDFIGEGIGSIDKIDSFKKKQVAVLPMLHVLLQNLDIKVIC